MQTCSQPCLAESSSCNQSQASQSEKRLGLASPFSARFINSSGLNFSNKLLSRLSLHCKLILSASLQRSPSAAPRVKRPKWRAPSLKPVLGRQHADSSIHRSCPHVHTICSTPYLSRHPNLAVPRQLVQVRRPPAFPSIPRPQLIRAQSCPPGIPPAAPPFGPSDIPVPSVAAEHHAELPKLLHIGALELHVHVPVADVAPVPQDDLAL